MKSENFLFAEMALVDSAAPVEFAEFDENIPTDFECASCGYKWSGGAGGEDDLEDTDAGTKSCPRCSTPLIVEKPPETFSLFELPIEPPDDWKGAYDDL